MKENFLIFNTTSTEYKYDYYTWYEWNGVPNFYYEDSVAHAWQSHTTSVASNGAHNYQAWCTNPYTQQFPYDPTDDMKVSVYGTQSKFDLYGSGCKQYGTLHDEVRIPISNNGQTGTFVSSYAHPWVDDIIRAVIGFLNIDWESYIGDEYSWRNTFTIGQSS